MFKNSEILKIMATGSQESSWFLESIQTDINWLIKIKILERRDVQDLVLINWYENNNNKNHIW